MRTRLRHRLKQLIQLTTLVLLVTLGATIPANLAVAFSDLCCEDCEQEHGDCPEEQEQDCDCPLGCATCCTGSVVRAVAQAPGIMVDVPVRRAGSLRLEATSSPPAGVSRDILHVPKLSV